MERCFAARWFEYFSLHISYSSYFLYMHYVKTKLPDESNASADIIASSLVPTHARLHSHPERRSLRATNLLFYTCPSQWPFRDTPPSYHRLNVCCMAPLFDWLRKTLFQAMRPMWWHCCPPTMCHLALPCWLAVQFSMMFRGDFSCISNLTEMNPRE